MNTIKTLRLCATALLRRCLWPLVRRVEDLPLEANGDQRAEWTHRHGLGVKWLLITTDELAVMKRMHDENRKMRATLKLLHRAEPNTKIRGGEHRTPPAR